MEVGRDFSYRSAASGQIRDEVLQGLVLGQSTEYLRSLFVKDFVVLFALASAASLGFKGTDLPKRQIDPFLPEQHKGASPVFQH